MINYKKVGENIGDYRVASDDSCLVVNVGDSKPIWLNLRMCQWIAEHYGEYAYKKGTRGGKEMRCPYCGKERECPVCSRPTLWWEVRPRPRPAGEYPTTRLGKS